MINSLKVILPKAIQSSLRGYEIGPANMENTAYPPPPFWGLLKYHSPRNKCVCGGGGGGMLSGFQITSMILTSCHHCVHGGGGGIGI